MMAQQAKVAMAIVIASGIQDGMLKHVGGSEVVMRFCVADHNPSRGAETLQRMLEPVVRDSSYVLHTPEILAARRLGPSGRRP